VKRCYILGAGFSKACGLPLASELTSQVFEHAYPPDFWHAENRETYRKYLATLYPNCDLDNDWPDFEDLTTVLDEYEDYRQSYEGSSTSGVVPDPAHLKSTLLRHLGLLLCDRTTSACSSNSIEIVKRFVRKVNEEESTIISFNWDLLIEVAAKDLNLAVTYGGKTCGDIRIAKPHGSLNLAEESRQHFEKAAQNSINVHNVYIDWQENDTVIIRASDPCDAASRTLYPFGTHPLVEPTARKSYSSKWIQLQWRRALDIVRTAQEIIVLGYSLPDSDFRPRILLQLAGFNRNEEVQLKLVDPRAAQILDRYKRFLAFKVDTITSPWQEIILGL